MPSETCSIVNDDPHQIDDRTRRIDDWSSIDWPAAGRNGRRLHERIVWASQNGEHARVTDLQKLLVRSRSAKLLAIRWVTQINLGKKTPGIDDGVACAGNAGDAGGASTPPLDCEVSFAYRIH